MSKKSNAASHEANSHKHQKRKTTKRNDSNPNLLFHGIGKTGLFVVVHREKDNMKDWQGMGLAYFVYTNSL